MRVQRCARRVFCGLERERTGPPHLQALWSNRRATMQARSYQARAHHTVRTPEAARCWWQALLSTAIANATATAPPTRSPLALLDDMHWINLALLCARALPVLAPPLAS